MVMAVDVGEREARPPEFLQLRADLRSKLRPDAMAKLIEQSSADRRRREPARGIDEVPHLSRGERRPSVENDEVKPDGQPGMVTRERDRLLEGVSRDHEARARQDAVVVSLHDRGVDFV